MYTNLVRGKEILYVVPQIPVLGVILLNIFICDMFLILDKTRLTGYADGSTSFIDRDLIEGVLSTL